MAKDENETTISFRTSKVRKAQAKRIIDIVNNRRKPKQAKKNYKFLEEVFIEYYKNNPAFLLDIEIIEAEAELDELLEEKEILEFRIQKKQDKINNLYELKKNEKLDKYLKPDLEDVEETPYLIRAFNNLISLCKSKGAYTYEEVKKEWITAKANTTEEVLPEDLEKYLIMKLEEDPDLIRNFEE